MARRVRWASVRSSVRPLLGERRRAYQRRPARKRPYRRDRLGQLSRMPYGTAMVSYWHSFSVVLPIESGVNRLLLRLLLRHEGLAGHSEGILHGQWHVAVVCRDRAFPALVEIGHTLLTVRRGHPCFVIGSRAGAVAGRRLLLL